MVPTACALRSAAGALFFAVLLIAAPFMMGPAAAASPALPEAAPALKPSPPPVRARTLLGWHRRKARGGPTFAGSPAWRDHVTWVEGELRRRGLRELRRDTFRYDRWWTRDDPGRGDWALEVAGRKLPVASYWAYSGSTPATGITAPLMTWRPGLKPGAAAGRILVFSVPPLPVPLPGVFTPPGNEYATPDLAGLDRDFTTRHWYQVNYATRFGNLGRKLATSGAVGGVVILDMGPERARGLYTFPLLEPGEVGVPALYVDRAAGTALAAAADQGAEATLTLKARREGTETWFLSGILPGRDYGMPGDELVLLITHTDGPNLTQENGALGILAILDGLARTPRPERRRSILVVLDPQHYMPGRHLVDWFERHPDLTRRIVASVGVEQLGQREYVEEGERFRPSGLPEVSIVFSQDNPLLIAAARSAIEARGLPRTELRVPARQGQGRWMGLGEIALKEGWPGYALNTDMSAYWAVGPGLESFDAGLAARQAAVLTDLTRLLMASDRDAMAPRPAGAGAVPGE